MPLRIQVKEKVIMTELRSNQDAAPRLAWVTGASKGIGRAVVLELATQGWRVAASGRDTASLEELVAQAEEVPGSVYAYPFDIRSETAAIEAVAAIERDLGPINTAILNAGTHEPVDGSAFTVAPLRRLVEINLMGTANCLAPVIERFVARSAGRIAVVSSMAGYCGLPTASAYGASKAALINMCEALRPELDREGITLSVVTPGFVRTPLTNLNQFPMPFLMEPEAAAQRIVRGIDDERFEITFPRRFSLIMKALRLLPYPLFFAVSRRLLPKDEDR
jgi:short-subunit dehydrogenase